MRRLFTSETVIFCGPLLGNTQPQTWKEIWTSYEGKSCVLIATCFSDFADGLTYSCRI